MRATTSPGPAMRGVVEGYYGRPWTRAARCDVIRFLSAHGLNTFVYAPKNDPFHRASWREPYPDSALDEFARTLEVAGTTGVDFVYAISPALDIRYANAWDLEALVAKLRQIEALGVRRFALFFDDAPDQLTDPSDVERYGGTGGAALGRAHADLTRRVVAALGAGGRSEVPIVVPTEYVGTASSPYLEMLGRELPAATGVGWTGRGVFAPTITAAEAQARRAALGGLPVVLWDNVPVNDGVLAINLHLGPLTGRAPDLPDALGGYLLNPMTQAYASCIPLQTAAEYLRDPQAYDPEKAWRRALDTAGGPGLAVLAENSRSSALDLDDAHALARTVATLAEQFAGPDWATPLAALEAEERRHAAAPDQIAAELADSPLAAEIAPWVDELAAHARRGLEAVHFLRALKPRVLDVTIAPGGGAVCLRGRAVAPDTETAQVLGPGFVAEATAIAARIAAPELGPLISGLGDLLGPDIRLCTEFGLNVHGKALYLVIHDPTHTELIGDRNVHDRLIQFVGAVYGAWVARAGHHQLTVMVEGAITAVDPDGRFSVPLPVRHRGAVRVQVATAAGDATAVDVFP